MQFRRASYFFLLLSYNPTAATENIMTSVDSLPARDRERLLERLAELRELDRLMRQPGSLAAPQQGQDDSAEGTTVP